MAKRNNLKENDMNIDDFGFSAVTADEVKTVDTKAERLYSSINKLLENLEKNPEKEYIYWPDRVAKINEFRLKLNTIMNGE